MNICGKESTSVQMAKYVDPKELMSTAATLSALKGDICTQIFKEKKSLCKVKKNKQL